MSCLLKCDALSREGVVKTVPISPRWNKELRPGRDFPPSMLLYGALSLFRTNFPRCYALLSFVTSSLASPMVIILHQGGQLQNYLKLDLGELENHLWGDVEPKSSKKKKNCRATYVHGWPGIGQSFPSAE